MFLRECSNTTRGTVLFLFAYTKRGLERDKKSKKSEIINFSLQRCYLWGRMGIQVEKSGSKWMEVVDSKLKSGEFHALWILVAAPFLGGD